MFAVTHTQTKKEEKKLEEKVEIKITKGFYQSKQGVMIREDRHSILHGRVLVLSTSSLGPHDVGHRSQPQQHRYIHKIYIQTKIEVWNQFVNCLLSQHKVDGHLS